MLVDPKNKRVVKDGIQEMLNAALDLMAARENWSNEKYYAFKRDFWNRIIENISTAVVDDTSGPHMGDAECSLYGRIQSLLKAFRGDYTEQDGSSSSDS